MTLKKERIKWQKDCYFYKIEKKKKKTIIPKRRKKKN